MKKLILFIYLFILLFTSFKLKANDCVPLTFEQLSYYIHSPVSYDVWYQELMKDGHPPDLDKITVSWNKLQPNHELICVWGNPIFDKTNLVILDDKLVKRKSYFWIGEEPEKYIIDKKEEANCHAALCFFDHGKVILITTDKPHRENSSAISVQELTYQEF
jgi:hypothetical protein